MGVVAGQARRLCHGVEVGRGGGDEGELWPAFIRGLASSTATGFVTGMAF